MGRAEQRHKPSEGEGVGIGGKFFAAAIAMAGVVVLTVGNRPKAASTPTRTERLIQKYRPWEMQAEGEVAFRDLIGLTRQSVNEEWAESMYVKAEEIRDDIADTSAGLLATGKDYGNHVDEYDVAQELLSPRLRAYLGERGGHFVPVEPVACDALGESHIDPYDYTNRPAQAFSITQESDRLRDVITYVPLGTAQYSTTDNPAEAIIRLSVGDNTRLLQHATCSIAPQIGGTNHDGAPLHKLVYSD